jgi:hypothetical protein
LIVVGVGRCRRHRLPARPRAEMSKEMGKEMD